MSESPQLTVPTNQKINLSTAPLAVEQDKSKLPKITVITPSYNQANYLRETCRSIVEQNYPNLEWFICDGGSTDGSVDVIKDFEPHLAWWTSEKDRGQTDALNKGYARATGEISCFVNSDDTLEAGALHYAARAFTPEVNWIVGWAVYFDNAGDEWVYGPQSTARPIDMFLHNPVPQISSFWRTSARDKVGLFDEAYQWSFDYEYWMRLYFKAGWKPTMVRRCLGGFRLHMESKSVALGTRFIGENTRLRDTYGTYLNAAEKTQLAETQLKLEAEQAELAAWDALKAGDVKLARTKSWQAVKQNTRSSSAWKSFYCALRGR